MILLQDEETGYWNMIGANGAWALKTHTPDKCEGRLCDVHNRRGTEPWSNWPLNWRDDRGMMEVIDPETGIGHPTAAQAMYWATISPSRAWYRAEMTHGCDGGCVGLYD